MKILVSACLLGENCKYNGGNNYCPRVAAFAQGKEVLPVRPALAAGFGCPRIPMEIVNGQLINREGKTSILPWKKPLPASFPGWKGSRSNAPC